ncbi:MAG: hypothetical protein M3065_05675 [Actinomycetota bacterium]|nr:hypothetical protein [Actinomycetota bacterium]
MATRRGLDDRAQDRDGQIRKKNGATKMKTLANEYPECAAFDPNATLSGIRRRYKVDSVDEVRAIGAQKLGKKKNG